MKSIEIQLHIAAQYLAAAGISFLPQEDDDSHTNLGFNTDGGYLETHPLSDNNDKLILNYKNFSLEWKSDTTSKSFKLDGASHKEVVNWIVEMSRDFLKKEFKYKLHYELPYTIDDTYIYKLSDAKRLNELMHLRILVQFVLETIDADYELEASVRIWPHHFDTGIYSAIPDSDISIGLGLAIPDSLCDAHYLYITGYDRGTAIPTVNLNKLSIGEWKSEGFTGAILDAKQIVKSDGVRFFKEVISQLVPK